jgi:hypothetical protein
MICTCGNETIQAKDGLCKRCRLLAAVRRRQKYHWTPELDAMLRRAYRARNKRLLGIEIAEMMRRTRWPRHILQNRAQALGLRLYTSAHWTDEDVLWLRELAGSMTARKIARLIGHTESGVCNKIWQLGLSRADAEGFSINELCRLFGVHHAKVEGWIARGWLTVGEDGFDRVTYASVERFVWEHMDEYRFAACEEWWLKTMLKPPTAQKILDTVGDARRQREIDRKPAQKEAA